MREPKFIPILMSTPMVVANLDDSKNQTRRFLKHGMNISEMEFAGFKGSQAYFKDSDNLWWGTKQKYFVGDILWVRETFTILEPEHCMGGMPSRFVYKADCDATSEEARKDYIKSGYPYQWKPNLFMPKDACRLFLEVVEVRVERLNDISEQDAIDEGIQLEGSNIPGYPYKLYSGFKNGHLTHSGVASTAIRSYQSLWESINGKGSWAENPFVWVVKYKRIDKPNNFLL